MDSFGALAQREANELLLSAKFGPPGSINMTYRDRRTAVAPVVGFMVLLEFISGVDQGIFPVLLPAIADKYDVSASDLVWVSAAQLTCAVFVVPAMARVGDIVGHRIVLRAATLWVTLASILTALAPVYGVFLLGRFLAGPLVAWLPLQIAIISSRYRGEVARRGISLLAGSLALGVAVGGLAGAYLQQATDDLSETLLISAGLVAAGFLVSIVAVPESTVRALRSGDVLGFVGIAVGLGCLQLALARAANTGWLSATNIALFSISVATLTAWSRHEMRSPAPAIDLPGLVRPGMWQLQLASLFFGMALFGNISILPIFLAASPRKTGYGLDLDSVGVGWVSLSFGLAVMLGAALTRPCAAKIGLSATIASGGALVAAGFFSLAGLHGDRVQVVVLISVCGLGFGLAIAGLPAMIAEFSADTSVGISAGVYNTVRVLGGSLMGGIFSVVLAHLVLPGTKIPKEVAYDIIWLACGTTGLLALVVMPMKSVRKRGHT